MASPADPMTSASPTASTRLRARLAERASLLAAFLVVLIGLVGFGGLAAPWAAIAFVLMLAASALMPRRTIDGAAAPLPGAERPQTNAGIIAFADALTEPCLVLDRRTQIIHRNGAAQRQFPSAAPGRPVAFSLRNPELVRAIERAGAEGMTQTVELHETVPSETWNKVTVAPLRTAGGDWAEDEGRLLAVTFQSLTELKRVDAMRSDFIANASHELRTPLASLLGFIETLQGSAARDAAAREKFLAIMRGQAERMARLIEDLLSLSRIEMHQHVLPVGQIDLVLLLGEVREGLHTQAEDASVVIELDIEPETAITTGDREQLYEVFENLIDNAIKYGASAGKVEVALRPSDRIGYAHLVTVTDHGPGVAEEHVPRLTERFYRVDAESSRKKKGTGLGLAIVKHIVNRHRGLMTIRSRPGEGMRVEVLLPR